MPKLSDYVDIAAAEYLRETGRTELDARWIADFYQNAGVLDDYPRQDLVVFSELVQKVLTLRAERAGKEARRHLDKIRRRTQPPEKP